MERTIFIMLALIVAGLASELSMRAEKCSERTAKRSRYPKPKTHRRGVDMGSLTNLMWAKHSGMNPYVNALPTSGDTSYLYLD